MQRSLPGLHLYSTAADLANQPKKKQVQFQAMRGHQPTVMAVPYRLRNSNAVAEYDFNCTHHRRLPAPARATGATGTSPARRHPGRRYAFPAR
jgi:hypothetical protein